MHKYGLREEYPDRCPDSCVVERWHYGLSIHTPNIPTCIQPLLSGSRPLSGGQMCAGGALRLHSSFAGTALSPLYTDLWETLFSLVCACKATGTQHATAHINRDIFFFIIQSFDKSTCFYVFYLSFRNLFNPFLIEPSPNSSGLIWHNGTKNESATSIASK